MGRKRKESHLNHQPVKKPKIYETRIDSASLQQETAGEMRTFQAQCPPPLMPPFVFDDIKTIHVSQSAVIESKVKAVLTKFEQLNGSEHVSLLCKASAANKCISIVEIAKRTLLQQLNQVFQYTGFWVQLEQAPKLDKISTSTGKSTSEDDLGLNLPPKVRNISCMVICLSKSPVPHLKDTYGEQICKANSA